MRNLLFAYAKTKPATWRMLLHLHVNLNADENDDDESSRSAAWYRPFSVFKNRRFADFLVYYW